MEPEFAELRIALVFSFLRRKQRFYGYYDHHIGTDTDQNRSNKTQNNKINVVIKKKINGQNLCVCPLPLNLFTLQFALQI